jgi:hypothetical protein
MDSTALLQASVHKTEQLLFFTLLQLVVIIMCARIAGNLALRRGNARAVGEVSTVVTTPALRRWLRIQPVAELEQGRMV